MNGVNFHDEIARRIPIKNPKFIYLGVLEMMKTSAVKKKLLSFLTVPVIKDYR